MCGNGTREGIEVCDGAACKTAAECTSDNACIVSKLEGSAKTCDAECTSTKIEACVSGDGCCAAGCDHGTDDDCSPSCGDGVLTGMETCEPGSSQHPCPTIASCDDGDPCTEDSVTGSAQQCSAECANAPLKRKQVDCDDADPCTDDESVKSTTECTYECQHSKPKKPTGSCEDSDPCTDDTPVMSETACKYECPHRQLQPSAANCNDNNPCTDDTSIMSRTQCAYDCSHTPMATGASCGNGRMCSSAGKCEAPPLGADGASCRQSNECAGGHCGNGVCCSGTTCCASLTDCPATTATCDGSTCQGKKTRYECKQATCVQVQEDDDSECAGRVVSCSPQRKDIRCTEEKQQADASKCACASNEDCLGMYTCIYNKDLVLTCSIP